MLGNNNNFDNETTLKPEPMKLLAVIEERKEPKSPATRKRIQQF